MFAKIKKFNANEVKVIRMLRSKVTSMSH